LDAFNPNLSIPTINFEEAYNFASLLFSPPQLSTESSTPTDLTDLSKITDQDSKIPRMRGQVANTLEGARPRKVFDRVTATPATNPDAEYLIVEVRRSRLEKTLENFTEWAMENGSWKPETKFLEKEGIRHILGAPQVSDMGQWKEEATKFIVSRYHQGYLWLDNPIAITGDSFTVLLASRR
jgi:hypothetical protein